MMINSYYWNYFRNSLYQTHAPQNKDHPSEIEGELLKEDVLEINPIMM